MTRTDAEHLANARAHLRVLHAHMERNDLADDTVFDAVCMRLSATIESISAIDRNARDRAFGSAWPAIASVRNRIAHGLDRLAEAPEVVRTGVSASAELGAGLAAGGGFEGYVRADELDELVERFGLDDQTARPNVLLRVVDDAAWPFRRGQRAAGRAVFAVDLLESDDPRARRAGAELLGPDEQLADPGPAAHSAAGTGRP